MKKVFVILAVLLVFSLLLSCNKDEAGEGEATTPAVTTAAATTAAATENRISQSTLPPLTSDEEDEDSTTTAGGGVEVGDASLIVPETDGSTAGSLNVREDSGFGGEVNYAK